MPNFNTHWCVALEALRQAPDLAWINRGREAHARAAVGLGTEVRKAVDAVSTWYQARDIGKTVTKCAKDFRNRLAKVPATYDAVTAFSAFALGACGPDFWTLTQGIANTTGEHHFDLGHYNRTHAQFRVTVARMATRKDRDSFPARFEQAYFLGMATHVAADLVIHQLVNRSAGAYNLLEKGWRNQNGSLPKAIWSTHNKVEHFWDSYFRYRYIGDYEKVFPDGGGKWFEPHGLPVIETLIEYVRSDAYRKLQEERQKPKGRSGSIEAEQIVDQLVASLSTDTVKFAYESPLILPQVFCDRLCSNKMERIAPFIYDVVVEKRKGAYPEEVVPPAVTKEARSWRMKDNGKSTEALKAAYFTSDRNTGCSGISNNYLTYVVCPNVEQLRRFGRGVFYDFDALKPFFDRAVAQAKVFVTQLSQAYQSSMRMRAIENHWNLDTGIGLRVVRGRSQTPKEVVTRLDFIHIFDPAVSGVLAPPSPTAAYGYLGGKAQREWEREKGRAFEIQPPPKNGVKRDPLFPHKNVAEEKKFLERILLDPPLEPPLRDADSIDDSRYFARRTAARPAKVLPVRSQALKRTNEVAVEPMIAHRLNLEIAVRISKLGGDDVGMFLFGDDQAKVAYARAVSSPYALPPSSSNVEPSTTANAKDWFKRARMLDHSEKPNKSKGDLCLFAGRLLVNLEPSKTLERKEKSGEWNNVVPYEDHEKDYGRNFAICTARKNVLFSTAWSKNFAGNADLEVYRNLCPTEQIFFSVRPLVRTPEGVFDVFSKERVQASDMKEIKRIQAIGFMKIVLFYDLGPEGACQLSECLVDGERMKVIDEPDHDAVT